MKLAPRLGLLFVLLSAGQTARADVVALALSHPRRAELSEELERELHGFGHQVRLLEPDLSEQQAEQSALELGAHVVLGPAPGDALRLRARRLSPQSVVEDASLPSSLDQVPARVFANVAASAVLHVLAAVDAPPRGAGALPARDVAPGEAWKERTYIAEPGSEGAGRHRWFFARLGANLGLYALRDGQSVDPQVSQETLANASAASNDPAEVQRALRRAGYDCDVALNGEDQIVAGQCGAALDIPGLAYVPAGELVVGAMVTERVGLALGARFAARAGRGALNRTVLGLNLEAELLDPRAPWSLRLIAGPSVGRARVRVHDRGVYITSGVLEFHGGVLLTYRVSEQLGVYTGVQVRRFFPDTLTMADLSLGLAWTP